MNASLYTLSETPHSHFTCPTPTNSDIPEFPKAPNTYPQ